MEGRSLGGVGGERTPGGKISPWAKHYPNLDRQASSNTFIKHRNNTISSIKSRKANLNKITIHVPRRWDNLLFPPLSTSTPLKKFGLEDIQWLELVVIINIGCLVYDLFVILIRR